MFKAGAGGSRVTVRMLTFVPFKRDIAMLQHTVEYKLAKEYLTLSMKIVIGPATDEDNGDTRSSRR